jgi:hypothetical protein
MPVTKKTLGTLLLIAGVSAWGVFYGLRALTPLEPPFGVFLTWHLLGVIPGAILRGSKLLKLVQRGGKRPADSEEPSA